VVPAVGHAAAAPQAAQGAEEVQPQAAASAGAAVLQQAAAWGAEEPQQEERTAAQLRVVRAAQALPSGLLSALAFRRDQAPPWPAQSPAVRFARATGRMRIASP
jgi:hypothetical protein